MTWSSHQEVRGAPVSVVPRTLGESGGFNGSEVLASMYAAHEAGNANAGLDIDDGTVTDAVEKQVLDVLSTKRHAIKLAVDSAIHHHPAARPESDHHGQASEQA